MSNSSVALLGTFTPTAKADVLFAPASPLAPPLPVLILGAAVQAVPLRLRAPVAQVRARHGRRPQAPVLGSTRGPRAHARAHGPRLLLHPRPVLFCQKSAF